MFGRLKYSSILRVPTYRHVKELRCYYFASAVTLGKQYNILPSEYLDVAKTRQRTSKEKRSKKSKILSKKEYLYGISPCLAALEANRRTFYTIFANTDAENMKIRPQFKKIKYLAGKRMITIKNVSKQRLDNLCGNRPHQNIVMKVANLNMIPLDDFDTSDLGITNSQTSPPFWLILDGIQDPMNLGGILRTSAYLGVDKIVSSNSDSCSLTPTVSKASAGAMEVLPLYSANVLQLLKRKREANWQILGAVHPQFKPPGKPTEVVLCNKYHLDKPSILVLGNEGSGLSKETQKLCTTFLTIPSKMYRPVADLDSLNVSVATGILLHSLLSSRDH